MEKEDMKILLEAYSAISPLEDIYDLVSKSNILYRLDGIYTIIGNQSKKELIDVNNIDGDKFRDIMWNKDMEVAEKIDVLFDDEKHKDSIDIEDMRRLIGAFETLSLFKHIAEILKIPEQSLINSDGIIYKIARLGTLIRKYSAPEIPENKTSQDRITEILYDEKMSVIDKSRMLLASELL